VLAAINGVLIWYRPEGALSAAQIASEVADLSCAAVLLPTRAASRARRTRAG
jgi:hypothetical protein